MALLDEETWIIVQQNPNKLVFFNIKQPPKTLPELEMTFACLDRNAFHPGVADSCETHVMQLLHLYQGDLIL